MDDDETQRGMARFWSKVKKTNDGCWLWTAGSGNRGYGHFWWDGKARRTHRLAYEFTFGPIPHGMAVCHRCDNPPCCNPAHLWLGTIQDNNADKVAKRRHRWRGLLGEEHPRSKLNEKQIIAIRQEYALGGITHRELAKRYHVTRQTIGDIMTRRSWSHLP